MDSSWHPQFKVGDRVRLPTSCGLWGVVLYIAPDESAYVVEVNGNPEFRLLCTDDDLDPAFEDGHQMNEGTESQT